MGWEPAPGWEPSPEWGPPPRGWQLWIDDAATAPSPVSTGRHAAPSHRDGVADSPVEAEAKVPFFGARGHAKQLTAEVAQLRAELDRLGALEIVELERRREQLRREIAEEKEVAEADGRERLTKVQAEMHRLNTELAELQSKVVITGEASILQEVGVYEYRHPLTDAAGYKDELARLQDQIKAMAKRDGGAISAVSGWTVNSSAAEGRKMVRDISKLMLRAYNAEADNLVRALKPYKLQSSVDRLDKVVATIERLGTTMSIRVAPAYHQLRIRELELTADYLQKVAVEKEREREEKDRLREERKVQQEIERERARLEKERQHYANALMALEANGDVDGAARLREQLDDLDKAIQDVDYRAANIRAGYVYVISNVGAFGERMIKVGMTRRLEPLDRVRELSDASVPFNFDVHALFFSNDAVGIESAMHAKLADRRVNRVNMRREFFYATPAEARDHLLALTGDLLQFEELPEALEFHQSSGAGDGPPNTAH